MLDQPTVNRLLALQKMLEKGGPIDFPTTNSYEQLNVRSTGGTEGFLIDVNRRGQIKVSKCTYQERYDVIEILLRLDVDGPPHENPDGDVVPCPHLHIYKEGYADKWAYPISVDFTNTADLVQTLHEFLQYCLVQNIPLINAYMSKLDCDTLVKVYSDWLKSRYSTKDVNGVCEITTPFLDRHNDRLQIYVKQTERGLQLTDDGYILNDLEMSGCSISTTQRKNLLRIMLGGFGVEERNGELLVDSSIEQFPQKKHALLQAMIAVNDMFLTAKKNVSSLFHEDVQNYLEKNDVRYSPNVGFIGKSGYPHRFDFVIPHSREMPERVLRAINHPTRESAINLIFAWHDTKEVRPANSTAYAILNDHDEPLKQDVLSAFNHYEVKTILWSHRHQFIQELSA